MKREHKRELCNNSFGEMGELTHLKAFGRTGKSNAMLDTYQNPHTSNVNENYNCNSVSNLFLTFDYLGEMYNYCT